MIRQRVRYLSPSSIMSDWGLEVLGAGCVLNAGKKNLSKDDHHPMLWSKGRRLTDFCLVYLIEGKGEFETEIQPLTDVTAGDMLVLFPGHWHHYRPTSRKGWLECWVLFNGPHAQYLLEQEILNPEHPILKVGKYEKISWIYDSILRSIENHSLGSRQMASAWTNMLLAQAMTYEQSLRRSSERTADIIDEAIAYIQSHLCEDIDLEKLAGDLCISYVHFRRLFRQHTGASPHQYHLSLRINRAKELLLATNLSVKEVGFKVGFNDMHYFARLFRKKTNCTPTEWRGM